MTDAALALQQAVVTALLADSALAALVADRIHDAPPRGETFPYLVLGDMRTADWSTGTEAGAEHRLTLHVWSRARGKRQCHEIVAAAKAVLHDAALTLTDHTLVNLRLDFADSRREGDGITYHGLMQFRAVTEPA